MMDRYDVPVGLSDHSGLIAPSVAAAVLGANLVEAHLVFLRTPPDVGASLDGAQFVSMTSQIRDTEVLLVISGR